MRRQGGDGQPAEAGPRSKLVTRCPVRRRQARPASPAGPAAHDDHMLGNGGGGAGIHAFADRCGDSRRRRRPCARGQAATLVRPTRKDDRIVTVRGELIRQVRVGDERPPHDHGSALPELRTASADSRSIMRSATPTRARLRACRSRRRGRRSAPWAGRAAGR